MRTLHRSSLRRGIVAAGLAAACAFGAVAASPAQPGSGNTPSATAGHNVYAAGGQVRPGAPVTGDFTAAAGKLVVDQPVGGDATLAGGSVDVRSPVGDDVRAAGGDVSIEHTIGGELVAAGGNVSVLRAASVGRGARLYGSNITLEGRIAGDLQATGGRIRIDGEVRGNARLVAREIELGPGARIGGALRYASGSELKRAEGAVIAGPVTRDEDASASRGPPRGEAAVPGARWVGGVMSFLALLACAALFLLLFPRFASNASERIRSTPWLALGGGLGTVVAAPVLAVLLFVTVLGIPLGIAVLAMYPVLLLAGFVVGVLFVAHLLAAGLRKPPPTRFARTLGFFALGLLLTLLAAAVPYVGGFVIGLLGLAGVGACVVELYHRRNAAREGRAAEPARGGVPARGA